MYYTWMSSPVGDIMLTRDDAGLRMAQFGTGKETLLKPRKPKAGWTQAPGLFHCEIEQLEAYFAGSLRAFKMDLAPAGTPFQQEVWSALQDIPYGQTFSYGEVARAIGKPSAVRAVGAANGANPIGIVIPCHRVIGANGSLTGYGGGLENKALLLEHERRHSDHTNGSQLSFNV